jgi:IMP dehydrogenase/GMP reductase
VATDSDVPGAVLKQVVGDGRAAMGYCGCRTIDDLLTHAHTELL